MTDTDSARREQQQMLHLHSQESWPYWPSSNAAPAWCRTGGSSYESHDRNRQGSGSSAARSCDFAGSTATHAAGFERTLPAEPRGEVEVRNPAGAVQVSGWDRDEVAIVARLEEGQDIDVQSRNGRIIIEVSQPNRRRPPGVVQRSDPVLRWRQRRARQPVRAGPAAGFHARCGHGPGAGSQPEW